MDDAYAIRLAKTKLRDAYSDGDVNGVLSVLSEGYCDTSTGLASFYGPEARAVLKDRLKKLFAKYKATLAVTMISIRVQGPMAFDWGWHKLTLKPKSGGRPITTRSRYLEIWDKDTKGEWKIVIYMDNPDVPPQMPPKQVLAELRGTAKTARSKPGRRSKARHRG